MYFHTSARDALSILKSGKLAHKWTRTIIFESRPEINARPDLVSLCFKPNPAIVESKMFKGREWVLGKKEWGFYEDLERVMFNDMDGCRKFLLATKILGMKPPFGAAIYAEGHPVFEQTFLAHTLDWRYSLPGIEALRYAISTFVDFDTIPQEFWPNIPQMIDALSIARIGLLCGGPHSKWEMADKALRMIDSGFTPNKYFSGKLPGELIAQLMIRTAEMRDL